MPRNLSFPARQRLPDEVYAELVGMMFSAMMALVSMAIGVTAIGTLMSVVTGDLAVAALTLARRSSIVGTQSLE